MFSTLQLHRKRRVSAMSTSSESVSDPTGKKLHNQIISNNELLKTGQYSDFTLFCGAREFRLHRSIVCPRSSFFASALDGNFMESGSRVVTLQEDDPAVVQKMLEFLYTSDYDEATQTAITEKNGNIHTNDMQSYADDYERIVYHVHLYAIADKYDIKDLKDLSKAKFQSSISGRWPIPFFPALVQGILNSTPPEDSGLREIITPICADHVTELLSKETAISYSSDSDPSIVDDTHNETTFIQTLSENGAFTSAILTRVARDRSEKLMEADAAYAGLSQEFVTYKAKSNKETNGLKAKLQQARKELNDCKDAMRAAGRQPLCCEGEGFLPTFSPGPPPGLRLQCAACRSVYN